MKQFPVLVGFGLAGLILVFAGCVQQVGREGTSTPVVPLPTSAPTSTFTPVPTLASTPAPSETPTPTSTTAPSPTVDRTPVPTEEPVQRLVLNVQAPRDGSTVRTDAVVVYGITAPGALVDVGGVVVPVGPDGRFQAEVSLSPGVNVLQVVTTDTQGNRESSTLNITSLALPPLPFMLLVTEPEDQSVVSKEFVRFSGRTGPEAIASINGVSVSVDELGNFSTVVILEPGPNIIDVVAANSDGSVLSKVIALIYRP